MKSFRELAFGRAVVAAVGMQKGGVGKTTNTLHLAAALAERGRRVLLWDVDENYGATKILSAGSVGLTTTDLVMGKGTIEDAIVPIERFRSDADSEEPPRLDFIPSSRALQGLERAIAGKGASASGCLRSLVQELREMGRYDVVLIDTGPQASPTTRGAYLVADYFILSVTPEKQAIGSLPDALKDVMNARRAGRNPDLELLGLVLCCMDRRLALPKKYEAALDEGFMDREGRPVKFRTTISRAAAVDYAYRENMDLLAYAPRHRVSGQFRTLAEEVEGRIRAFEAKRLVLAGDPARDREEASDE